MPKHSSSATPLCNIGEDYLHSTITMGGGTTFHTGIGGLKHKRIAATITPTNLLLDGINFPKGSEQIFIFFNLKDRSSRIDYNYSFNFIMS